MSQKRKRFYSKRQETLIRREFKYQRLSGMYFFEIYDSYS